MKRSWAPHLSVKAAVQPIPPHLSKIVNVPSSSTAPEVAYTTSDIWQKIRGRDGEGQDVVQGEGWMAAVEWPKERRLVRNGKGKGKEQEGTLIILVKPLPEEAATSLTDPQSIYVPSHLLPAYSAPPLRVIVHRHTAVSLSSIILQAVQEDVDDPVDVSFIDLEAVRSHIVRNVPVLNGPSILRQGNILSIPLDYRHVSFRLLMLEPVRQGIPTATTQLILSSDPYIPPIEDELEYMDENDARSSYARTHLSLSSFDPDAFLSGSLSLQSRGMYDGDDASAAQGEWYGSNGIHSEHSTETSGSTTPRALRPHSPAVPVQEIMPDTSGAVDDDMEEPDAGSRFAAIPVAGPSAHASGRLGSSVWTGTDEGDERDVCWVGVGGLGRAGIFEGDWVILRSTQSGSTQGPGRLVKVLAWEQLDDEVETESLGLPFNPILVPPVIYRCLIPAPTHLISGKENVEQVDVTLTPTSFGSRTPSLPVAKSMTVSRIATTEGLDKRYERAWLKGLKAYFATKPFPHHANGSKGEANGVVGDEGRLVRRGDIFAVPIYQDRPITDTDPLEPSPEIHSDSDSDSDDRRCVHAKTKEGASLAWFIVTALSFEPLIPIEDDFRSSASAKARAGELGCWVDVGDQGETKVILAGVERARVGGRGRDRGWSGLPPHHAPAASAAQAKLRELLSSALTPTFANTMQLSVLIKGARGSGKRTLLRSITDELGYNVIEVDCHEITSTDNTTTTATIQSRLTKARAAAPSILLLHHIEALSKKSEAASTGRESSVVKTLQDALTYAGESGKETGWSVVLMGTVAEASGLEDGVAAVFKQEVEIGAPNEVARTIIVSNLAGSYHIAPDVSIKAIATQTAALHSGDIRALFVKANDLSVRRAVKAASSPADTVASGASGKTPSIRDVLHAGISITSADITSSLSLARSSYSDSIGAPKIPNVSWDDVGGLASVKAEILDTIQLPLSHPELFASGIKKRSGILLYGPPGTGKTLLAKAVATSCGLNFFSVKGPELLNMYIGESEANVRRVFQKAREASPCVIFMDELDSVAPKRGNQGDSGGVMDRIVSQLLAELDGMGGGGGTADSGKAQGQGQGGEKPMVFVMGATNRPDLLDPALLRPGRFDRLVYLSPPTTRSEQAGILRALTRKFDLHEHTDLDEVVAGCGFNMTGADFYALASDAMLGAMGRVAGEVDARIEQLEEVRKGFHANGDSGTDGISPEKRQFKVDPSKWPTPLTPQYYLAALATEEEIKVKVKQEDFSAALARLRPSVSEDEMRHYDRVQRGFRVGDGKGQAQAGEGTVNGSANAARSEANGTWVGAKMDVKGKGKARADAGPDGES